MADTKVNVNMIGDGQVATNTIAPDAVTTAKIADLSRKNLQVRTPVPLLLFIGTSSTGTVNALLATNDWACRCVTLPVYPSKNYQRSEKEQITYVVCLRTNSPLGLSHPGITDQILQGIYFFRFLIFSPPLNPRKT